MRIKIVIGDWSQDGHNKYGEFYIDSNLNSKEIIKFYKLSSSELKFDLIKDCCSDYQDNKLSDNIFNIVKEKFQWCYQTLLPLHFLHLYLLIVKYSCPIFEYNIIEEDYDNTINIGGYGLYDVWG